MNMPTDESKSFFSRKGKKFVKLFVPFFFWRKGLRKIRETKVIRQHLFFPLEKYVVNEIRGIFSIEIEIGKILVNHF